MDPNSLIEDWLSSPDGTIDQTLGWAQIDVIDLVDELPRSQLFDWSMELFVALVEHLTLTGSDDFAILTVPLRYSDEIDLQVPTDTEVSSIGELLEAPALYRTRVLLDAWQPVERFRIPTDIGLTANSEIRGFYTCWRSMDDRLRGEEFARDLHYLWGLP